MRVHFIAACRNAAPNIVKLVSSVKDQTSPDWLLTLIDDASTDDTLREISTAAESSSAIQVVSNSERRYALHNIVNAARSADPDDIIATLDGDDSLCNNRTVEIILEAYGKSDEVDAVWTAHRWDTNGMNISREMPDRVDSYAWPWVSSHLRTFRASLIRRVSDDNFKDPAGSWFKRGYDQALMLPILHLARRRVFVPEVCYQYNIDSSSIPAAERNWSEMGQISTVNIVRARGFLA